MDSKTTTIEVFPVFAISGKYDEYREEIVSLHSTKEGADKEADRLNKEERNIGDYDTSYFVREPIEVKG